MSTDDNTHDTSGYWVLTGDKYPAGSAREIKPTDWPYFGSIVKMLKPSERVPALTHGVDAGHHAAQRQRAPGRADRRLSGRAVGARPVHRRPLGRRLPGRRAGLAAGTSRRCGCERRVSLFEQVGRHLDEVERTSAIRDFDDIRQAAFGLLTSGQAREAFDVRASRTASASATARTAGASACCWPGG